MLDNLKDFNIILASRSPRRRHLLKQLGLDFTEISAEVDESYPEGMDPDETAIYLAEKKADHFAEWLEDPKNILITADTLVLIDGRILGKPDDKEGAAVMLKTLSGKMHQVVTGICIRRKGKSQSFTSWTDVYFKELTEAEIEHYLETHKPYDKAGAYGIQEWIGYIGITRIEGSYFNVMGLPVQKLYEALNNF
ncbi:MAG: Maf family nucleotide pyrophosphatase [Bacteroidales bacterium]|jgi:septum formation protein|nr:Maf family nucleotide pyrophosphatase [Bacteroidales bacterium]